MKKNSSVLVPLDMEADKCVDYDNYSQDQVIEIKIDDSVLNSLFENKILETINDISGSMIDEFEHDKICDQDSKINIVEYLSSIQCYHNDDLEEFIGSMIGLFGESLRRGTPVHFFL